MLKPLCWLGQQAQVKSKKPPKTAEVGPKQECDATIVQPGIDANG